MLATTPTGSFRGGPASLPNWESCEGRSCGHAQQPVPLCPSGLDWLPGKLCVPSRARDCGGPALLKKVVPSLSPQFFERELRRFSRQVKGLWLNSHGLFDPEQVSLQELG